MKILLVLAGNPPGKKLLEELLAHCDISIAVDGGYQAFTRSQLTPDVILGDLDSAELLQNSGIKIVHTPDQEYTDLQKALNYLQSTYQQYELILLGSGGRRTDHLIHNLQICAYHSPDVSITLINEPGRDTGFLRETIHRITPVKHSDLRVSVGSVVSFFNVIPFSGLTASGLKWPLAETSSADGFFSQSNRTIADTIKLSLIKGSVYLAIYQ